MVAYDLLAIDLDGTLLGPGGRVSERNARAVRDAAAAGLEVIIATGRALAESRAILDAIMHEDLIVSAGGSMLSHAVTQRTLYRRVMPVELVHDIATALLHHDRKALILKDADVTGYDYLAVGPEPLDPMSETWFEMQRVTVRFVGHLDEDPDPDETVRVGAVAAPGFLEPIAGWIRDEVGDRVSFHHWGVVAPDGNATEATHLLEVYDRDVNKWTMLAALCAERGIDPRRVAAIGDGVNDVEMVREAGLGVAMGNADPRVRAVAEHVTEAHGDDGVAAAIERMLDGTW